MRIDYIKIKNFRGLDLEINGIAKVSTLIGKNDSGKSNVCAAILKVLDYEKRKEPLLDTDSTLNNKEPIVITIKLLLDDLNSDQSAIIREYIHVDEEDNKYMYAELCSIYNEQTLQYEDSLLLGDPNYDFCEINPYRQNELDKILSIVYINAVYNKTREEKLYFEYKEKEYKTNDKAISNLIKNNLEELKTNIQNEENILEMQNELNNNGEFDELLDNLKFNIVPNIKMNKIYKSLNIVSKLENGNELDNIGDGKNKIFSMLLKTKTYDNNKKKIFIVEEPENHLYVLLQRNYVAALLTLNPDQLMMTTHSPYIVDFEKTNQIIKLINNSSNELVNKITLTSNIDNTSFKEYGYLITSEVAEMLYYDNVLLVEGSSEKYFYNLLLLKDDAFRKKIYDKRFGIFSVNGIAFEKIKNLLEKLGINVYIKTDNDIFEKYKKNNSNEENKEKCYAGLSRCVKYLNEETKNELMDLLHFDDLKNDKFVYYDDTKISVIEENIEEISNILLKSNVLFSTHNVGFERDFLEYINWDKDDFDRAMNHLKKSKLIYLHNFIEENDIDISINENNKDSILIKFLNENNG